MSNSVRPCERQPANLLCPWDSPSKNIGMGSHALPQGALPSPRNKPVSLMSPALAGLIWAPRLEHSKYCGAFTDTIVSPRPQLPGWAYNILVTAPNWPLLPGPQSASGVTATLGPFGPIWRCTRRHLCKENYPHDDPRHARP